MFYASVNWPSEYIFVHHNLHLIHHSRNFNDTQAKYVVAKQNKNTIRHTTTEEMRVRKRKSIISEYLIQSSSSTSSTGSLAFFDPVATLVFLFDAGFAALPADFGAAL